MRTIFLAGGLAAALAAPLGAQVCAPRQPCPPAEAPGSWRGHAEAAGVNALLGGVTAGVLRKRGGGSFREGFLRGAAGGGAVYAGKWVAVGRFEWAGFVGRQVAAVGGSEIRNAAAGMGVLEQVVLPLGPVRVYTGREAGTHVRVDATGAAALAVVALRSDSRFHPWESLTAGAPVFQTDRLLGDPAVVGSHVAGIIMLRDVGDAAAARVLAHERVHVLQNDQAFLSWAAPFEEGASPACARAIPPSGTWTWASTCVPWLVLNHLIPYEARPWEREAYFLTGEDSHRH
jgi:hypothetical protein